MPMNLTMNRADRQLRVYKEKEDLLQVVDFVIEETKYGI